MLAADQEPDHDLLMGLAFVVVLVPLGFVLFTVIYKGAKTISGHS